MNPPFLPAQLKAIATAHRWQNMSVFFLVLVTFTWTASETPGVLPDGFSPALMGSIMSVAVVATWAASIFLGWRVFSGGAFIVTTILSLIPPIALIIWVVVNMRATKILRSAGAKVGLWGASTKTLPPI
ncbi:MAG: hypothetical protein V4675_22580 [Verrucomicrobiota bacterium]